MQCHNKYNIYTYLKLCFFISYISIEHIKLCMKCKNRIRICIDYHSEEPYPSLNSTAVRLIDCCGSYQTCDFRTTITEIQNFPLHFFFLALALKIIIQISILLPSVSTTMMGRKKSILFLYIVDS